jgi:hypothetical protein
MQNSLCHTIYLVTPPVVSVNQMHNSTFGLDENEYEAIEMLIVRTRQTTAAHYEQHFVSSVVFDGQLLGKLPDSIHYFPFFMCSSYNVAQMFSTRIEYLEVL